MFLNANTTFKCRQVGYFADTQSSCRLYHICHRVPGTQSRLFYKYSFMCHNRTVFNQATLACTNPEESLPCEMSEDFYFVHGNEIDYDQDEDYAEEEALDDLIDRDYTPQQQEYNSNSNDNRNSNSGSNSANDNYDDAAYEDERELEDMDRYMRSTKEAEEAQYGRRLSAPAKSKSERDEEEDDEQDFLPYF